MKKYYLLSLLMVCMFAFSSCSDDDDKDQYKPFVPTASNGAYVMNQGSYYSKISSTIGYLDYGTQALTDSVFVAANGFLPGNTLQGGIIYGDHLFVIAYESNVLFVANKNTLKVEKQVKVSAPRALATADGYVFISNFDGYVTRFNARTMTVQDSVKVGPNPEEMAVANGYLYVAISDGMNYMNGYANGKKVAKVNLSTFSLEKEIPVRVNPNVAAADNEGNVYVISQGNYGDIKPMMQKIDKNDKVSEMVTASLMCIDGSTLYAIYADMDPQTYVTDYTYFSMDLKTGITNDNLVKTPADFPTFIKVDPVTKHIFIGSDNVGANGSADYATAGYINEYKADGTLQKKHVAGVHPVQMVFNLK